VLTFHQLADRVARQLNRIPDFSEVDAFSRLERVFLESSPDPEWMFDELIVDEGQDFPPEWGDALLRLLNENGRAWWLDDPMQNLYGRDPFRREGWVELRASVNYRSPRVISDFLSVLSAEPLQSGSPIEGAAIDILEYGNNDELNEQTKRAIGIAIAAGFPRTSIALLSCHGRQNSRLATLDRLGPYSLRRFSGQYDLIGRPIFTDGDIVFDSVLRFKGCAAPFVVLSEVDFEHIDEPARRRLFVGASRATLRVVMVATRACAVALRALETAKPD
jgi:hypothetical protein